MFDIFEVYATPRDPYTGNKLQKVRLKLFATEAAAKKFKFDWEFDYAENCDKRSDTCGKSPCWIDYEPKLEIVPVTVNE